MPVDTDSPPTAAAANAGFTEDIDLLEKFTLYLVWQYNSGILYPIANILWQVNFLADTNIPNVGVTNIVIPHGLTAGTYTASNAVPGALAPPVAYGNFIWA